MKNKLDHWLWAPIMVWLLVGVYGVFHNITYIDESKYLIKGWLMATGRVGYYSTPEFFYQHMPGGLLWYGWGQKLFGPSLLVGRVQAWLVGWLIIFFGYRLTKKLAGKKAGLILVGLFSLLPVVGFYYANAIPQSVAALSLLLASFWLYEGYVEKKPRSLLLASLWFGLSFIIRINFLFSLGLYLLFLSYVLWQNKKQLVANWLVVAGVIIGFMGPGYPGIIKLLGNVPGLRLISPVSPAEMQVLESFWQGAVHDWRLYLKAVLEFGVIYHALILIWGGLIGYLIWKRKKIKLFKAEPVKKYWGFLMGMTGFNVIAHVWGVVQFSPRAVTSYLTYLMPLIVVITVVMIVKVFPKKQLDRWLAAAYLGLLVLSPVGIRVASIFSWNNTIRTLRQTVINLKPVVANYDRIVWLADPMSLYLSGRLSYYSLINHTNFYKPVDDTETVRNLGFWNQEMMGQWLEEAELVVVDPNRLELMNETEETREFVTWFNQELANGWQELVIEEYIWPERLRFYTRSLAAR